MHRCSFKVISLLMAVVFLLSMVACNTVSKGNQIITPDKAIPVQNGEISAGAINPPDDIPDTKTPVSETPRDTTDAPITGSVTPLPTPPSSQTPTPPFTGITVTPPETTAIPLYKYLQFRPTEKLVAITFDDGPSSNTPLILNKIEGTGSKVTFFVIGNRLENQVWASATKRAIELGCEIGFHTWDHEDSSSYTVLTNDELAMQISKVNALLKELGGSQIRLLRPTGGSATKGRDYGYPLILWMGDTEDWKIYRDYYNKTITYEAAVQAITDAIVRDATKNGGGNIVLMHDLYSTTCEAFCRAYDILTEQGYKFVTVSELLDIQNRNVAGYTFYSTYAAYYLGNRCQSV